MRSIRTLSAAVLLFPAVLLPAGAAQAAAGVTTVLDCSFDAEPIDQVIGTGGAAAGEPISLDGMPALVRATPFATPSLAIVDSLDTFGANVRFGFLNDWEISHGVLDVSMTLYFHELDNYSVGLREQGSATVSFLDVRFYGSGAVGYADLDTGFALIGTYAADTPLALHITLDLDAQTYDVSLGGVLLLDDESLGSSPRGIGTVYTGVLNDGGSVGSYSVDDLLVTATELPNAIEPTSWGELKAAWR